METGTPLVAVADKNKEAIKMFKGVSPAGLILLVLANPAFAAHPLVTDDTGTQGRGKFQLEINGEYTHEDEDGVEATASELAATGSYGVSDRLDLVIGAPYQWLRDKENGATVLQEKGLSDISAELKWRFLAREGFSFALKPGISLPTGDDDKGLGSGEVAESVFLISTFGAEPFALHANLGYIHNENNGDDREDIWHASLAAERPVTEKLTVAGNLGIERNPDPNVDTDPAFILGGLIYGLSEDVAVDLGVKAGLNGPETDYSILAGVAWRF